jgi:serine/threonine-protein kinase
LALAQGTRLGPYEIVVPLGAGGMGEVYKARDPRLARDVAIKVLPPSFAADASRVQRFEQEARAVAALSHPNILAIFDIGSGETPYLVTELLDGETLRALVDRGPLATKRTTDIALQFVAGLIAAHSRGIVHRDLKPENIFLTRDGVVKILDFGLAKAAMPASDVTIAATSVGQILGTVGYMAPEQVRGEAADPRSDLFAVGTILYEMVSGERAFRGNSPADTMSAVLREQPADLVLRTGTPPAVARIVRRCLEKDANERFQSARELHFAIDSMSGGQPDARESTRAAEQSIAVLPFANMSADADNQYFSDGLAEELINALAQIDGLRVAARTSSFSFKGKSLEIGEIARKLNVRHVLEGSVRKAGSRVRITAQLVDASNGYQVWSERYDRQLEDIFDVQDEIARTIVERLKIALSSDPGRRLVRAATADMDAYQWYLKGRALLYKRGTSIARALECFQQAVELDPGYADAWAGLADSYTTLAYYGFAPSVETLPRALDAAKRAVEIDPGAAAAHSSLAMAALLWDRDFETAEREFERALALNPTYTQARCWYAVMFLQGTANRLGEGVEEARRAVDYDPLSGYAIACHTYALSHARRTSEALVQGRLALESDPESFIAGWALGNACHWGGRFEEAVNAYEHVLSRAGRHPWALVGLAATYSTMGRHDDARGVHEELLTQRVNRYVQPTMLAMSASAAGDHEAAIGFCRQCVDERDALFGIFNRIFVDLDPVRADPRFAGIVSQFNSPR